MTILPTFLALVFAAVLTDTVRVDYDCGNNRTLCDLGCTVKKTLEVWYPILAGPSKLNQPNALGPILVYFDPNNTGVAYTSGTYISASIGYYLNHMTDIGSFIHEMVHVIQAYRSDAYCPGWIVEGIADYYRYFVYQPQDNLVGKPGPGSNWTDGYGVTAYFFNFVNLNYKNYDIVYWLNKDCRDGAYLESIWVRLPGKPIGDLWQEMMDRKV